MTSGNLALSRGLLAWLREAPDWSRLPFSQRAQLAWKAGLGSLNARLSQAQVRDMPPLQAPILILGPWRSGTTVMHELLTAATGLPTPLTWQCMNACAFQLMGRPSSNSSIARPMDGLEIGPLSPQEDEFALLSLGVDSAYRAFLQPDRLPGLRHTLEAEHWLRHPEWLSPWELFLQGVLQSLGRAGEPLILKSPNHSFRIRAILERFPEAKVVWLCRHPLDTFHSNRKMWRQMFAEHRLRPTAEAGLDEFLACALESSATELEWLSSRLPPQSLAICDQSQLLARPKAMVTGLLNQLALPRGNDVGALEAAIKRTRRGRVEHYQESVPPLVEPALHRLAEVQSRLQSAYVQPAAESTDGMTKQA